MIKTIAIPVHLQKDFLTEEEQEEKKKYGDHLMTEEEIEALEAERAQNELNARIDELHGLIQEKKDALDRTDIDFARALRRNDKEAQAALKDQADDIEKAIQDLENEVASLLEQSNTQQNE
jgi:molecular chaperone GrpE (heat shock protein)